MKIQQVDIPTGEDGYELSGYLSAPDEALSAEMKSTLVVMVHDIPFGHIRQHNDLFGYLRNTFDEFGLNTLCFDFQSCGDSDGEEEDFTLDTARANLKDVLRWGKMRGFQTFMFVAAGAGAVPILEAASETTRAIFLFWPVVDLSSHGQRLFGTAETSITLNDIAMEGRTIGSGFVESLQNYDLRTITKSLRVPILIQYGAQDEQGGSGHIDIIKDRFNALRIDITSYGDGGPGLTDPRHRKMIAHHTAQFLHKYA